MEKLVEARFVLTAIHSRGGDPKTVSPTLLALAQRSVIQNPYITDEQYHSLRPNLRATLLLKAIEAGSLQLTPSLDPDEKPFSS